MITHTLMAPGYTWVNVGFMRKGQTLITAYLYNSCTSCRKAKDVLENEGANYEVREYFKQKVTREELDNLLQQTGLTVADILSTRSTPYKQGNLAEKNLSDSEILDMMTEEPRLIKRPILVSGSNAVVGFNEARIQELIALDNAK